MIYFFHARAEPRPIQWLLTDWAPELAKRLCVLPYEDLHAVVALQHGAYIFADIERTTLLQARLAAAVRRRIVDHGAGPILNHPGKSMRRVKLLATLVREGINDFRAHRLSDLRSEPRYPVFLRLASSHDGVETDLIHDRAGLEEAVLKLAIEGVPETELLVVEYLDFRGEDGLVRKYSVMRVGDRYLPRHMLTSDHWVIKVPGPKSEAVRAEELAYLDAPPHMDQIERVFELANIEYGRIDYGVRDGRIQVFEINTHPVLFLPRKHYKAADMPVQKLFVDRFVRAVESLDATAGAQARSDVVPIELTLDDARPGPAPES